MILIIGQGKDPHIESVTAEIAKRNEEYFVLDVYGESETGVLKDLVSRSRLSIGAEKVDLEKVESVWWRQKPKFQMPSESAVDLYDYYFVQREWNTVFDFLAESTRDCWSINNRRKAKIAENKCFQLDLLRDFELEVPATIMTNNALDASNFFRELEIDACVFKTFSPYIPPTAKIAYTTEIDIDEITNEEYRETIDVAPGIFQERICPMYELRITVVGDSVYSAKIEAPDDSENSDWRASIFANRYSVFEIEDQFRSEILKFHQKLGLVFAAYDFIVDQSNRVYFLEVNPAGQWIWLEDEVELPISRRIAHSLISHS